MLCKHGENMHVEDVQKTSLKYRPIEVIATAPAVNSKLEKLKKSETGYENVGIIGIIMATYSNTGQGDRKSHAFYPYH